MMMITAPQNMPQCARLLKILCAGAVVGAIAAKPVRSEEACEAGQALSTGLCAAAQITVDTIGNLRGGVRSGAAAIGQAKLGLQADLEKSAGLVGWTAQISGFGIYGRQPTPTLLGSLAPVSNIEAQPTIRLFEAWAERKLGDWGALRFGQLAADSEFAAASFAGNLVNGSFGWPVALANSLPSGGAAYPLATPGIRLALGDAEGGTGLRLGAFSGDPGGRYGVATNPQVHNLYGTNFSTSGGVFYISEFVTGGSPAQGQDGPRPWVLKLGGWYHNGGFDSVRYDQEGLSLADPASSGIARRYAQNYGGYAVAETVIWRGDGSHIGLFTRGFLQPADRNAVDMQLDGGVTWNNAFGQDSQTLSIGTSWARIGTASRAYDEDQITFGASRPIRSHEAVLEINYDIPLNEKKLSLRPLAQFLFNPAAKEPDERRSATQSLPNAIVVGLRMTAIF